jgi:uncharacterized protein YjcR
MQAERKAGGVETAPLSKKQMAAVHLLATGMRYSDVYKVVGISPNTLLKWRRDPAFSAELSRAKRELS